MFDWFHIVILALFAVTALWVVGGDALRGKGKTALKTVESSAGSLVDSVIGGNISAKREATPGTMLDQFLAFADWLKAHRDVPPEAEKALETIIACLAHAKATPVPTAPAQGA